MYELLKKLSLLYLFRLWNTFMHIMKYLSGETQLTDNKSISCASYTHSLMVFIFNILMF